MSFSSTAACTWTRSYPCQGQGIFVFNIFRKTPFEIVISPENSKSNTEWISLYIGLDSAQFKLGGTPEVMLTQLYQKGAGYNPEEQTSYWLSFDRDSVVMKYGKGYFMEETTILAFDFLVGLSKEEQKKKRSEMKYLFCQKVPKVIQLYDMQARDVITNLYALNLYNGRPLQPNMSLNSSEQHLLKSKKCEKFMEEAKEIIDIGEKVCFYSHPLTVNWPFAVRDSSSASLFELDQNNYTFSANLPTECLELYKNVSSASIDLDWTPTAQKYNLSDAIRYSMETKGKALHEKLKHKAMKYLRVTIGSSRGSSPGIPYVLELWPPKGKSPVHNHGNSYAIIKVLFGGLRIEIYNKDMKTKIKSFDVQKGDVTWLSPNWYQTHKLVNNTKDFCATIQCYRYGEKDKVMWPYFDYIKDNSTATFLPDGDFTFNELNNIVLNEYAEHIESIKPTAAKRMKIS